MPSFYRALSILALGFTAVLAAESALGQDQRFVTDRILVPLRSGAGGDYRILNKGLPSGTAVRYFGLSEDEVWAEVETAGGTRGWMRAQYLQSEAPISVAFLELQDEFGRLQDDRDSLVSLLDGNLSETYTNEREHRSQQLELERTKVELERLMNLAGREIELDEKNRSLAEALETQKTEIELLKLEKIRLIDRNTNSQILDGALAVAVGFLLAVFGPKLMPRRRKHDGWS